MSTLPICIDCARLNGDESGPGMTCEAFPNGIPEEILSGEFNHMKENHPKDGGLKFKPYKEGDK
jgi:hypothetical protein